MSFISSHSQLIPPSLWSLHNPRMRLHCPPFVVLFVIVCSLIDSAAVDAFVVPFIVVAQRRTPSRAIVDDDVVRTMTDHKIVHRFGSNLLRLAAVAGGGAGESSRLVDDMPSVIECYLVTDEAVLAEGDPPKIVCTSEPEDYAWFNGIDPQKLMKTDTVSELATECVEGASPRGIPEWECK